MGVSALPEKVDEKLQKYTQHFMTEVARVQGADKPQNLLATEVVRETETSMDTWLRKQQAAAPPTTTTIGTFARGDEMSRLFQDTGTRYDNMMAARAPIPIQQIGGGLPDFRAPEPDEDEEDPVILMQRAQKQREDQARALGIPVAPPAPSFPNRKVESAQSGASSVLPPRVDIQDEAPPSATQPIPPQADPPPPALAPRPQDYIIPQEDVVKYRETEYNVFITSADRNWMVNTAENRYNFSVIFNTGNTTGALGYNSAVQQRFRNIQRIEFVKAIVPIEALSAVVRVTDISGSSAAGNAIYDSSRVVNIFSLPFAAFVLQNSIITYFLQILRRTIHLRLSSTIQHGPPIYTFLSRILLLPIRVPSAVTMCPKQNRVTQGLFLNSSRRNAFTRLHPLLHSTSYQFAWNDTIQILLATILMSLPFLAFS